MSQTIELWMKMLCNFDFLFICIFKGVMAFLQMLTRLILYGCHAPGAWAWLMVSMDRWLNLYSANTSSNRILTYILYGQSHFNKILKNYLKGKKTPITWINIIHAAICSLSTKTKTKSMDYKFNILCYATGLFWICIFLACFLDAQLWHQTGHILASGALFLCIQSMFTRITFVRFSANSLASFWLLRNRKIYICSLWWLVFVLHCNITH